MLTVEGYNALGRTLYAQEDVPGAVLGTQAQLEAAREQYEYAIRLRPDDPEVHNSLGVILRAQGALAAAQVAHARAVQLRPDFAEAWWNCALVWLAQGNLAEGWPAYEWRWQTAQAPRHFPLPRWDGTSLIGRTILVTAEQDLGDELLFASCLPDLVAQAGHVVIACDQRLTSLFRRTFPEATVCGVECQEPHAWLKQVPPVDVYAPMGSLPLHLRPTLESFPTQPGYLLPDRTRCQQYRQALDTLGQGLKVGLAWHSPNAPQEWACYPPLSQWKAVLTLPGVHWINVQDADPTAELREVQQRWGCTIHERREFDLLHDLDGAAALLSALDGVISPETTVSALAGCLGRPVWRLTAAEGSWTSLGTPACPWFPSMRVVCPTQHGQWAAALESIARDLAQLVSGGH